MRRTQTILNLEIGGVDEALSTRTEIGTFTGRSGDQENNSSLDLPDLPVMPLRPITFNPTPA
jgi:hypothetical protein